MTAMGRKRRCGAVVRNLSPTDLQPSFCAFATASEPSRLSLSPARYSRAALPAFARSARSLGLMIWSRHPPLETERVITSDVPGIVGKTTNGNYLRRCRCGLGECSNAGRRLRQPLHLSDHWSLVFRSNPKTWSQDDLQRREFPRLDIHRRARIRIGSRQYAGFGTRLAADELFPWAIARSVGDARESAPFNV